MNKLKDKLKLGPDAWFAWQMIPGYIGERNVPYYSPIYMQHVAPRKTGKNILGLEFVNVFYAEGVQYFSLDIRILKHSKNYLMAEIRDGGGNVDRSAVISHIEFAWIEQFCPRLWYHRPPSSFGGAIGSSVSLYLSEIFGLGANIDR